MRHFHLFALLAAPLLASGATTTTQVLSIHDLAAMSLEQLANIEITSVSKKPERLADAPASVFVISADEIRRSGATRLPELLRLAPNLHVTQVHANGHAISARGFNNSSANKLLVLIDGRSVYSPLFSGVFWDVQDVVLEDVERIEVISGPGGTLWGVNAVNGVINIITRPAKETQGGLIKVRGGNHESGATARYGEAVGDDGHFRMYAKYVDREKTRTADGTTKDDASYRSQAGFRADWGRTDDKLMLQGNMYRGLHGQPRPGSIVTNMVFPLGPIPVSGANLMGHWTHALKGGGNLTAQAYYDRTERNVDPAFSEELDIADIQVQHSLPTVGPHQIVWGAEYRRSRDRVVNSPIIAFLPANLTQQWISVFAQDKVELRPDLSLTLGARVERNDYTGNEFLPTARLAWKMADTHLLWTALSRTVRAPSRLDHDVFIPGVPPFLLDGGLTVVSEVARVYELGYRGQPTPRTSYSVTVFHAAYDHLRTQEISPAGNSLIFANRMEGATSGIEMWGAYQASDTWRLTAGASGLRKRLRLKQGSTDLAAQRSEGLDPAHWWTLRSSLDLSRRSELDVTLRGVSALRNPDVPRYTTMDIRYGFRPSRNVEFSVTGTNLLDAHGEFSAAATRTEVARSFLLSVRWYFDGRGQ